MKHILPLLLGIFLLVSCTPANQLADTSFFAMDTVITLRLPSDTPDEVLTETTELIDTEREYLCRELRKDLALEVHAGPAPFILFRAPADTVARLMEQGILIRSCANFRGLDDTWFRIGIRTHEENRELVEQWRRFK